jgi:hypothetical protein
MIAVLEKLTAVLQEQPKASAAAIKDAIIEAFKVMPPVEQKVVIPPSNEPLVSLVNDLPSHLPSQNVTVATPSKDELARQWFKAHPEDLNLTGRELENRRQPMGVRISYVTWNKAKKLNAGNLTARPNSERE